jgi:hypothetical protein
MLNMAADYEAAPECRLIEQFVRELAPAIEAAQCGRRLNGDYELWLKLHPTASSRAVLITAAEYGGEVWKEKIKGVLEELNS